jgi:hypothetical protein
VYFRHYGINQRDEVVCDARRAGLMLKRPSVAATADAGSNGSV